LAAVILAAGKGGRMGQPKLNLELGGMAFWRLISSRLARAGVRDIAVVVRRSQKGSVAGGRLARAVVNRKPRLGMFSSVQCGLRALKGRSGYLLCPVDHPGVEVLTYRTLRERFNDQPDSIVRPQYRGKTGHPVIIPGALASCLLKASPLNRLDHLIKKGKLKIINVKVTDKNTTVNINTASELSFARKYYRADTRRHQG